MAPRSETGRGGVAPRSETGRGGVAPRSETGRGAWLHAQKQGVGAWLHAQKQGVGAWLHAQKQGVGAWLHGCSCALQNPRCFWRTVRGRNDGAEKAHWNTTDAEQSAPLHIRDAHVTTANVCVRLSASM